MEEKINYFYDYLIVLNKNITVGIFALVSEATVTNIAIDVIINFCKVNGRVRGPRREQVFNEMEVRELILVSLIISKKSRVLEIFIKLYKDLT